MKYWPLIVARYHLVLTKLVYEAFLNSFKSSLIYIVSYSLFNKSLTMLRITILQEKIGRCIMTLTRVLLEGEVQESFQLDGAKSGKLLLHLKWVPQLVFRDA